MFSLVSFLQFPYCDGAHAKHNQETGDNVGPLIIKRKEAWAIPLFIQSPFSAIEIMCLRFTCVVGAAGIKRVIILSRVCVFNHIVYVWQVPVICFLGLLLSNTYYFHIYFLFLSA